MGTVTLDQARVVMNTFCALFEDNLTTGEAVSWNEHGGELDDLNRLTVVEQIAPRYNVTRTSGGVKDITAGTDGTVFGAEQFTIDGTFNANMGWADFVKVRDIGSARESKALTGAATSMAEKIDAYILGIAVKASNNWTGTIGNALADNIDIVAGYTRLKEEGVDDSELRVILTHYDRQLLGDQVVNLAAPDGFVTETYREGFRSRINGMKALFTNQLPVLTVGSRAASGASQVDGANQNVNYADVAVSTANGRFLTQTIAVKGVTGVLTVKAGEVFTIAGVYAYDQRKQAAVNPPRLQQFTVVDDAVAVAGSIAALRIFPAMIVPASGAGDNININSAHATVTAAPADSAAIIYLGTASTAYGPRAIIQKQAISVDTIPLVMPATGIAMRKKLSNIPVTVRMWQHSDFNTGAHGVRFDVALNCNIRERRRIVRINGA